MATISFISKFDLSLTPTQFVGTDSTDYVIQGVALADVNGCFRIIAPSGVIIYDNQDFSDSGCDIKVSTSVITQKVIPLTPELGTYTITYTVHDSNLDVDYITTYTYDYEYVAPEIKITQFVNVIASLYSQTDESNYVVNGTTPTMVRVNKLVYPAGIKGGPPAPLTTTADTLKTNVVYNGPATAIITNFVTYTFADGLIVVDNLFGSKVLNIDGAFYCSVMCGLKVYGERTRTCDDSLKSIYVANFNLASSYLTLVMGLIDCNGGDKIDKYLGFITDIIGEDCGCGCGNTDDNFARITGWGTIIGADGINGINGINGSTWDSGTTLPPGGTGVIGDWWLKTDTGDIYKKTGTSAWTFELNIKGTPGALVLVNDVTVTTPSTNLGAGIAHTFKTYTLPANTLKTNGDVLKMKILATITNTSSNPADGNDINVMINSTSMNPSVQDTNTSVNPAISLPFGVRYVDINATLTRVDATTVLVSWNVPLSDANKNIAGYSLWKEQSITVANLTTNTNVINVDVYAPTADSTIQVNQLSIIYIGK